MEPEQRVYPILEARPSGTFSVTAGNGLGGRKARAGHSPPPQTSFSPGSQRQCPAHSCRFPPHPCCGCSGRGPGRQAASPTQVPGGAPGLSQCGRCVWVHTGHVGTYLPVVPLGGFFFLTLRVTWHTHHPSVALRRGLLFLEEEHRGLIDTFWSFDFRSTFPNVRPDGTYLGH